MIPRLVWGVVFLMVSIGSSYAATPNIVLILGDDMSWTDYGFLGHEKIKTPHLDTLAKESLCFTRGYVPSSLCRPSLATIVTGLYPHQNYITSNAKIPAGTFLWRAPMLPKLLAQKGYKSLQAGKWWEGDIKKAGFTHGPKNTQRHGSNKEAAGLPIGRKGMKPIAEFLDEVKGDPFFIWYAPFLPHTPHNPPARLKQKYGGNTYYAMCDWFDETCGQLLAMLEERKLTENTMVLYVCDNGWLPRKNFERAKRSPYDLGTRTPIMVKWPGKVKPKRDEKTLVSSIDLVPTILKACGIEKHQAMQGLDLIALGQAEGNKRDIIFGEVFKHDAVDAEHPEKALNHRWCIQGKWKLIVSADNAKKELYDLFADPHEQENLLAAHPDEAARLQKAMDAWWDGKAGQPVWGK